MRNVLVFSDSIGCGWSGAQTAGWVELLRRRVNTARLAGDDYDNIYNLSIEGETSESLRKRFRAECDPRDPDVIIIAVGINDGAIDARTGELRVRKARFLDNVRTVLDWAVHRAEKVLVLGIPRVDESRTRPVPWEPLHYHSAIGAEYEKALMTACEDHGAEFVALPALDPRSSVDGLHPGDDDHRLIADAIDRRLGLELLVQ